MLIARTDARMVEGLESALRRATAYAEAGANAVFVQGLTSFGEIAQAAGAVPKALVVNVPAGVCWTPGQLERAGCRLAIYPAELQRAALAAMRAAAVQLRE